MQQLGGGRGGWGMGDGEWMDGWWWVGGGGVCIGEVR